MIEWVGVGLTAIGAAVGYGELRGRVKATEDKYDTLREDIKHVSEQVEHLTDFLLREVRGEAGAIFGKDSNKNRR